MIGLSGNADYRSAGIFGAAREGKNGLVSDLHARLLERAVEILGGEEEAAAYLGVPIRHLRIWMRGSFSPPADVFLKLVDLVNAPGGEPPRNERAPR